MLLGLYIYIPRTAKPAAQERGLPPVVLKYSKELSNLSYYIYIYLIIEIYVHIEQFISYVSM